MNRSIVLNTDSYKASMWNQYPKNTSGVFSYIESRGGMYDKTVMFGLQAFIKEYLTKPVTQEDINFAEKFFGMHGEPFNKEGWQLLLDRYNGKLPIRIRAVEEGKVVPVQNVLATVENLDPDFWWLTTWVETALLRAVWYGTTVATRSYMIKQIIKEYLNETGDVSGLPFKLHDFGARGVSSFESAGISGAAHLINFMGTDTISGALYAAEYYGAQLPVGYSIPAAEHSTITSWKRDDERKAYQNMVDQFGGEGKIFAVVSDSYDIRRACKMWASELRMKVVGSGSTLVVRPDSGDPATVVLDCIKILDSGYGSKVNDKGFKVLNNVRVIQGDGICENEIIKILSALKAEGYSADNVAFGCGGYLLQQVNRDTQKFAMKCSAARVEGEWRDVYKDPVTDTGKKSKKGRVTLMEKNGEYMSFLESDIAPMERVGWNVALDTVYEYGSLVKEVSFDQVRENAA